MSDPKAVLLSTIDVAESGPFEYFLYGGMAVGIWGEPRYTEDVDLVLFLAEREVYKFFRAAGRHGFAVDEELAIQQIQVNGWARLPLATSKSPWHLDIALGDSPFDRSALKRRRRIEIFGRAVWVASPEDLLIYKLVSGRKRDLLDAQIVRRRRQALDAAYLRKWGDWWEREGVRRIRQRVEGLLR
ncbi:MAG: nucleotidyl transferase AbiEii/AbiGii toxin family protein [Planctomycetes bacterium]|nr:nucleotidyl transferase AbiEii/AbiGii toxin family protein [Planctomycetota bacterium]